MLGSHLKEPRSYTPQAWRDEKFQLVCSTCAQVLFHGYGDWEYAEINALEQNREHKCAPNYLKIKEAKELMKAYRLRHPNITFEEQLEVYNLIISQ